MSTRFCAGNGGLFGCERCDVKCLGAGASHRHKLRGNHETDATCVFVLTDSRVSSPLRLSPSRPNPRRVGLKIPRLGAAHQGCHGRINGSR